MIFINVSVTLLQIVDLRKDVGVPDDHTTRLDIVGLQVSI